MKRYDEGLSTSDFLETPKAYFRQCYYEALARFNQYGYKIYHCLETLMMKACKQEKWEEDLQAVCSFYKGAFNQDLLHAQLETFGVHFKQMH